MLRNLCSIRGRTLLLVALGGLAMACEGTQGEKGSAGPSGDSCSIKDNGDGTKTITCGKDIVTLSDGTAGKDGKACSVKDNGDNTKTITCGDGTSVTVANGSNGKDGAAGKDGGAGKDGAAGKDGTSCGIKDNGDGSKTITCTDGTTATVMDGAKGDQGIQGPVGATGTTGDKGDTGAPGADGKPCTIKDNGDGSKTITCADGSTVTLKDGAAGPTGPTGPMGAEGATGGNVAVKNFHGEEYLKTQGEYANGAKTDVVATITAATVDDTGKVTVKFSVADKAKKPVTGVKAIAADIAKLVGPENGESFTKWINYIYRIETVSGSATAKSPWPAKDGDIGIQAYRESSGTGAANGTLTNNGDGTYVYVFKTNLKTATVDGKAGSALVGYDAKLTHRVSITMGGHSGPTGDTTFDFVPDITITKLPLTRNIVETNACRACHGDEFHGHGGDRLTVETCVTCHNPSSTDAQSKESLDMKVMIHKIHAGGELASVAGPDGIVWDNPATGTDESADNGSYALWGYGNNKISWWKAAFPAVLDNCTKCHQGKGAEVNAWKDNPSRAACGSCHDTVNFATGVNHKGGKQLDDKGCTQCHNEGGYGKGPVEAHDFAVNNFRDVEEFKAEISISAPKSGKTYYEAGDAPLVTVIFKDPKTGLAIDHTKMIEGPAEGCWVGKANDPKPNPMPAACLPGNGKFAASNFFVHGPRAFRSPALTMAARAKILATTAGPYDLSADVSPTVTVTFDSGQLLQYFDSAGGDKYTPAKATVILLPKDYLVKTAVTGAELVKALNANAGFAARGIAYIDEATNKFAIRSRNFGKIHAVQLTEGTITTTVFGGDTKAYGTNSSTAANKLAQPSSGVADPKVTRTVDKVTYQLDPVDDLDPGTYTIGIEVSDRGRIDANNYSVPTVAFLNFTVKQATEELPIARNCNTCHQNSEGHGLLVDPARHNKKLSDLALDQCGSCHDYQPQNPKDLSTSSTSLLMNSGWQGSHPISRRIHAIHFGSSVNFPLQTVWYANGDPVAGRNWDITAPRDVRDCQMCHVDKTTSGTWATKPSRLACWGCHDSLEAQAHFAQQTLDPTPMDPWSGDEQESCMTCHK